MGTEVKDETIELSSNNEQNEVETEPEVQTAQNLIIEEDLKKLFDEYKVKYDLEEELKEQLLTGDIEKYQKVLETLKNKNALNIIEKNNEMLKEILINSDSEIIENVFEIVRQYLSVDEEDMKITTSIIISALPSIFVKEPTGNYETFKENIESLREWGIDLINLFDFSREVFVMNHEKMLKNYQIAKSYDLIINDKNAKYLLMLPNLGEKIDYYVEAVAKDTMKNGTGKTFDGIEYIKLYPNKLNIVNDVTIKRLKYSSENGKKIFGTKENSLAGEITNLKVDILNIDDEYLRKYFNNEFDILSREELMEYEKLINDNENISMTLDEKLEALEKYRSGLRYVIEGINISRNKLIRIYNILIENGMNKEKSLVYAACYNSVITKEEYQKIKDVLSNIGGE